MPALFTSMSKEPSVFSAVLIMSAISAGLVMSARRIDRLDAELLFDPGALFLDVGGRAEAVDQDVGAVLGKSRAMPSPIPEVEPVTTAFFPLSMVVFLNH